MCHSSVCAIVFSVTSNYRPPLTTVSNIRLAGWQSIGTVSVALAMVEEERKGPRKLVRHAVGMVFKFSTSR